MINDLIKLKHSQPTLKPNHLMIPVTALAMDELGATEFNKIYKWLLSQNFNTIKRTPSGGISYNPKEFKPPAWDVRTTLNCVELTIILCEGLWRIQFRNLPKAAQTGQKLTGFKAFQLFKKKCKEFNVDLNDYIILNGEEIKKTIEKPIIKLERAIFKDVVFDDVNHIDFRNSYPAGLINSYPEFRGPIEWMYEHRKEDDGKWKLVLNASIGYMQSISCCKACWAHLSAAAIKDNNDRVRELANRLKESGRVVICYNTDGIWYAGDKYKGPGEGDKIGQWHHDHLNCVFRAKSEGAYEFIEDGIYTPIVRGYTRKDKMGIDRSNWKWGDIYLEDCEPVKFVFDRSEGVILYEHRKI